MVRGDEGPFYFSYYRSEKWTIDLNDRNSVQSGTLERRKVTLTVTWSPREFPPGEDDSE